VVQHKVRNRKAEHGDKNTKKKGVKKATQMTTIHTWFSQVCPLFSKFSTQQELAQGSPAVSTAQTNMGLWHEDKFCLELTKSNSNWSL